MNVKDILAMDTNCKKIISLSRKTNIIASEWWNEKRWETESRHFDSYEVKKLIVEPLDCGTDINLFIII